MEPDGLTVGAAGASLGSAARSSLLLLLQNPDGGHMPLYLQPPLGPTPPQTPLYSGSKRDVGEDGSGGGVVLSSLLAT